MYKTLFFIISLLASSSSLAELSIDYFPIEAGGQWEYSAPNGQYTITASGNTVFNSTHTQRFISSQGDSVYITNNGGGIKQYGYTDSTTSETYSNPIHYTPSIFYTGSALNASGIASFQDVEAGSFTMPYSYNSTISAKEAITVPAGTFETYPVTVAINLKGTISGGIYDGYYIDVIDTTTYYLAKGIGIVKQVNTDPDNIVTTEVLVSTNLDLDKDTVGNAFDLDDDGDGYSDTYEVNEGTDSLDPKSLPTPKSLVLRMLPKLIKQLQ